MPLACQAGTPLRALSRALGTKHTFTQCCFGLCFGPIEAYVEGRQEMEVYTSRESSGFENDTF